MESIAENKESFEENEMTTNTIIQDRIKKLRLEMKKHAIAMYIIVSDDFHGSEYVGDFFKCREYVSGFDGSAGTLVICQDEAGLWTDGRYFIQAEEQLKGTGISLYKMGQKKVPSILEYVSDYVNKYSKNRDFEGQNPNEKPNYISTFHIGYDGRTINVSFAERLKKICEDKPVDFIEDVDLVNEIWENRPVMSTKEVFLLKQEYTGKSTAEKLEDVKAVLKTEEVDCLLLASLDDIAWLYNIRGNDVEYNPVVLSYSIVFQNQDMTGNKAVLYVDEKCIQNQKVKDYFKEHKIATKPYSRIYEDLTKVKSIMLDKNSVNVRLLGSISKSAKVVHKENPTRLKKAIKNSVEMQNERNAHIKDGVALTKLICYLKKLDSLKKNKDDIVDANTGKPLTELDVCRILEEYRQKGEGYIEQSFAPIAAFGAHGAIVHYEATKETNVTIKAGNFLLLDTGGHYLEGTTDVTRTISFGALSEKQKKCYTAVLRGNLNLAAAHFKYGCTGTNLDYLARAPLWEMGMDYNHGTGHGVGYLLNVHEGPNAFRLKETGGKMGTVLEEGMITSNEPGVYLENEFGIRLENLVMAVKGEETEFGQFMEFETLTLAPFDRNAILIENMCDKEIALLNSYHKKVFEMISPYLEEDEVEWLKEETKPFL